MPSHFSRFSLISSPGGNHGFYSKSCYEHLCHDVRFSLTEVTDKHCSRKKNDSVEYLLYQILSDRALTKGIVSNLCSKNNTNEAPGHLQAFLNAAHTYHVPKNNLIPKVISLLIEKCFK